jgi:hypothetical protein
MKLSEYEKILLYHDSKVRILGSYNDKHLKYYNDIDFQNTIHFMFSVESLNTIDKIYRFFFRIFRLSMNRDYYVTDFKFGELDGQPIRWSYKDMMKKFIRVNNKKITFHDALKMRSIIKIDLLGRLFENNELYTEITCNYFIKFNDHDTRIPQLVDNVAIEFYNEYQNNLYFNNVFKALKRLYKFFLYNNDHITVKKIAKFLNGPVGKIGNITSKYEAILLLLEKVDHKILNYNDVIKDLIKIGQLYLTVQSFNKFKKNMEKVHDFDDLMGYITHIINDNRKIINRETLKFIKTDNIDSSKLLLLLYKFQPH